MFTWGPLLSGGAQLNAAAPIDLVPDSTGYQTQLGDEAILDVSTDINLIPAEGAQDQVGDITTLAMELKHTVAPSGGDFTSLDAALDHLRASHSNFVTANVFGVIEIQGAWSSADTVEASTTGLTLDAGHPLIIRTDSANRASAQAWRTDKYRLSVTGTTQALAITGGEMHVYLDGLQMELYGNTSTGSTMILCDGLSVGSRIYLRNIRGRVGSTVAGNAFVFGLADSDAIYTAWNLIAEAHPDNVGSARGYYLAGAGSSGESKGFNLLGIGLDYSYRTTGGQCWALYDSIACNCNNDFYNAASDFYAVDYCASDDGDGTNPVTPSGGGAWWPSDFVDAANGDYRLKPGSALVGAASEIGDDYFSTDIDGQTRSNWDVGPHESVDVTLTADSTGYQTQFGDEVVIEALGGDIDIVPDQTGYQVQAGDEATIALVVDLIPDGTGFQTQLGDPATIEAFVDIVPDEGVQTQAGDEAALTQVHNIVAAEGSQDQVGDGATLAVVIPLEAAEGSQDQAGDTPTLAVISDLLPAEGSQDQVGDVALITKESDLVTDEGVQTQFGDQATLAVVIPLESAEGSQDQFGDGAVLTQVHNIAAQEGAQDQAGDEAALTQVHNLTAAEGSQDQAGDNAILEVAIVFIPAEGAQEQVGDEAALTQVHVIQAAEGSQDQVGDEVTLTFELPKDLETQAGAQDQAGDSPALTQVHNLETQEPEILLDGGLEDWITATNLRQWTENTLGTSTVNREAGAYQGSYCARFHWVSMDASIEQFRTLTKERAYRLTFYTKAPPTGSIAELWIATLFQGEFMPRYLQEDGSWQYGGFINIFPTGDWQPVEKFITLPAESNGVVSIAFHHAMPDDFYLDAVSLRLYDAARQEQVGDGSSLIVGLLTKYEFVDRLLLSDRIAKARTRRDIVPIDVSGKVPQARLRNNVARVFVHDKDSIYRLRRAQ